VEFVIKSIEPKSKYVVNKYYPAITGRECDVLHLMAGTAAVLLVDVPYDPGCPHHFHTTPVKENRIDEDGTIVFETENSVYTLVKKECKDGTL
jgi:hypothetical protein